MKKSLFAVATVGCVLASACAAPAADKDPVVVIETSLGTIKVELYQDKAPITVKNFLGYVDDKFYDGTIFHRVISDFMIQGGGFEPGAKEERKTKDPIKNEASNGLSNERGTIAMARLPDPDSATAQFYINVKNNSKGLDKKAGNAGYCVFGRVIDGMEVVDKIKKVKTNDSDRPQEDVVIKSIRRAEK